MWLKDFKKITLPALKLFQLLSYVEHTSTGRLYSCQNGWSKNIISDWKNLFTLILEVVITRIHDLRLMGGCPSRLVPCLHNSNELWLFRAFKCAVTPNSLVWHMMRLMLRLCQKSEHMQGDILAARGCIICLSSCHDWSVIRKGSEMWQHWHQMTGIYLLANELLYETATAKPRCGAHA